MNKKGFAISSIIYAILILFLALIAGILGLLGNRKLILDKTKNDVINKLNNMQYTSALYKDNSGAAMPELYNNMIPIVYKNGNWVYANVLSSWYDYDLKQWANAVVLNPGLTKNVGDVITESDIALWYVWIPRYRYVIQQNNNEVNLFTVEFESANANKSNGINVGEYITHPAFTFGNTELNGIWVGKFESSNKENKSTNDASLTLTIKPNVSSWRNIKINTAFTASKNVTTIYDITSIDSHLIKNTEWGAVAYLTTSIYGQGTQEIRINNSSTYTTGCAASIANENSYSGCQNVYDSSIGVFASTTGNVYGIYDMSGNSWELVMGVMEDNNTNKAPMSGYTTTYNSGYYGMLTDETYFEEGIPFPERKYYDFYQYSTDKTDLSRRILGDATAETSGWNSDIAFFAYNSRPWFNRGGVHTSLEKAGIFAVDGGSGSSFSNISFRSVLTKE